VDALKLTDYDALLDKANSLNKKGEEGERYKAYAKADAWLINNAFYVPYSAGGGDLRLSNIVPFSASWGWAGSLRGLNRYKYLEVQKDPITKDAYQKALKHWKEENAKAKVNG